MISTKKSSVAKDLQPWWKILYLIIITLGIYLAFSHWAYDDPFITYRYADNISSGLGFVYNLGERVLSTTTPLFALLLALLRILGLSIPTAANAISSISLATGGLLIWELARTWKSPWVGWAGLLLYPTFSLLLGTIGSETPFYLALCLGSFLLYTREQLAWSAILIALAALSRSDGILIAIIICVDYLWSNRSNLKDISFWSGLPWKGFAIAIGLLLGWHLFAWVYFGSPFPATLAAKQAQGAMAISTRFAPGLLRIASWYTTWPYWLALGLVVLGLVYALNRKPRWLLILSWVGLYFIAYTLLGVSSYYWYYAPLVPGWIVSLGLGLNLLDQPPFPNQLDEYLFRTHFQRGISLFLLIIIFFSQLQNLNQLRQTPDTRFPIYQAAGNWLAENTPSNRSVGALEVGIIGFYSQRPMIDFAGLIQPNVAEVFDHDATYEDAAFWAVQKYQPNYLVMFSGAFPVFVKDYVTESCVLSTQFSGKDFAYPTDLFIFDCSE